MDLLERRRGAQASTATTTSGKYAEVLELNKQTVANTRPEFLIEDGRMRIAENEANAKRKRISVFNTVKRSSTSTRASSSTTSGCLASAKGMTFTIQYAPRPEQEAATEERSQRHRKKAKTGVQSPANSIGGAKDLTNEDYDDISQRKTMGKTTTEDNLQAEKHYWQSFFLTKELSEEVLNNFIYGTSPLLQLPRAHATASKNHLSQRTTSSPRSSSQADRDCQSVLLERLGWASARDEDVTTGRKTSRTSFVESVVEDPLFKRQKRLNQLFRLSTSPTNRQKEMTPQQVLMWCNSLLKDFSLQIRAGKETYYLEFQNDLFALIKRKNDIGKIYFDRDNLLKQVALNQQDDLFIDDEPPQPEAPAEPQQEEEETPEPPVPEPEAPAEPQQEQETPPPQSTTPTQEYAEWKRETGLNVSLRDSSRAHAMGAEDGSLRHVVTRLVSLAVLVQYIAKRDLNHLPKTQTRIDRAIPNTTHYRPVVDRRHPQPQPLASVTELNISNRRHYIR